MLLLKPRIVAKWREVITLQDLNAHKVKTPASDPQTREEGVHVSNVISVINRRNTTGQVPLEEKLPTRMVQGLALESYYMGLPWHRQTLWQPGGFERDGIIGSPDGISPFTAVFPRMSAMADASEANLLRNYQHWCLEEFKSTYYSSSKSSNILNFKEWIQQIAAYLCILMKHKVTLKDREFLARLTVWWVMGDYKYNGEIPECRVWLFSFSRKDLDAFWEEFKLAKSRVPVPRSRVNTDEAISKFLEED